jgi:Transposase zinc-binding domain/Putative transposase
MKYRNPLTQISSLTRSHWDRQGVRPSVRQALGKLLKCGTSELGATVYASENQHLIVNDTCKSAACSSCGHRATVEWQRGWWTILPDGPYKSITFTMPNVLWNIFRENRIAASSLTALAANAIKACATSKNGLRVGILAILHTFNGRLEFNSHVHTMVSGGGLCSSVTPEHLLCRKLLDVMMVSISE